MDELSKLNESWSEKRENQIYDNVVKCNTQVDFCEIISKHGNNTGIFRVFSDALKLNGVRVNVNAYTQQKIADHMGCMLLTPKLADLIWEQAKIKLNPFTMPISSTKQAMIKHSKGIDKQLLKYNVKPTELVANVGKHWVIDELLVNKKPNTAMNYGWHFAGNTFYGIRGENSVSLPKIKVIQGRGTRHNYLHTDYSQTCVLIARECLINDVCMDLADVYLDNNLSYLVNHSGKMSIWRMPGVEENPKVTFIPYW